MIRRTAAAVLVALSATLLAACTGADAKRAQELLRQAEQAQQEVESMSFRMNIWTSGDGPRLSAHLSGGAYARGKRAGDVVLDLDVQGGPAPMTMRIVQRDGAMFVNPGSGWTPVPSAAGASALGGGAESAFANFDFSRYVKDVTVEEGQILGGKAVAKIVGVVDTGALIGDLLGGLGGLAELSGAEIPDDLSDSFGDTRAVLYVSEASHLVVGALVDLAFEHEGEKTELHVAFNVTGVDEPVKIPDPSRSV